MKPGKQMEYDPEEIRQWKKLIYGTLTNHTVDEWVSNGQDTRKSGRRKAKDGKGSNNYSSYR